MSALMGAAMDGEIEDGRASAHMSAHTNAQIAVVAGRRRRTVEQKLLMLRDAFARWARLGMPARGTGLAVIRFTPGVGRRCRGS